MQFRFQDLDEHAQRQAIAREMVKSFTEFFCRNGSARVLSDLRFLIDP